jgi:hypothetical protein
MAQKGVKRPLSPPPDVPDAPKYDVFRPTAPPPDLLQTGNRYKILFTLTS